MTEIARERLARHRLLEPVDGDPAELVARMGAVQAQDYAAMKWAVAQRCRGATDGSLDRALADGSLVRTHLLRPTWHVVAPRDLRWLLELTGPRVHASSAGRYRELGIDEAVKRRSAEAMTRALRGGRQRTRAELAEALEREGIDTKLPQRLVYLIMAAELDGVVCSGGRRGKQFTYALVDERVPPAPPLPRDEALAELARRYFSTRGPATLNDFSWWSGLTVGDGKRAAEAARLPTTEVDGARYWWSGEAADPGGAPRAHLLPYYDEYTVAYRDRRAISARAPGTRPEALLGNVVLLDGQVVGFWQRSVKRAEVAVELRPLAKLARAEWSAVDREVERYGAFHALPARARVEAA